VFFKCEKKTKKVNILKTNDIVFTSRFRFNRWVELRQMHINRALIATTKTKLSVSQFIKNEIITLSSP
jgi:hypothetical protein